MEYAKKAMLGYKPTGKDDPEQTHIILSISEYNSLLHQTYTAAEEARRAQASVSAATREAEDRAAIRIRIAQDNAQESIQEAEGRVREAQAEAEYQRGLNANLLRIARERANADRSLPNKKKAAGYIVLMSGERDYKYREYNKRDFTTVTLWETVIQTPYCVDFTAEQARKQTWEELWDYLGPLGLEYCKLCGYEKLIREPKWQAEYRDMNCVCDMLIKADFLYGYWKLVVTHTKPLQTVPHEMRPRVRRS